MLAAGWALVSHKLIVLGYIGAISPLAHALIGVAFGLLLVFRTNTSYDRFWEGRRLWGVIINEGRNQSRLVASLLPKASRVTYRTCISIFAHATMHRLRLNRDLGPHAERLSPALREAFAEAAHPPSAALAHASALLDRHVRTGEMQGQMTLAFQDGLRDLVHAAGGCDRIRATPIPFAYTVHLRRSLILYAATLPLALSTELGWATVPATLIVTFVLFGIEELGVSIEDPFGFDANDLHLEQFCAAVDACLFDANMDQVCELA